jgi:hypothetical protein
MIQKLKIADEKDEKRRLKPRSVLDMVEIMPDGKYVAATRIYMCCLHICHICCFYFGCMYSLMESTLLQHASICAAFIFVIFAASILAACIA